MSVMLAADRVEVGLDALALHLLDEAVRGLHATRDVLDRVVVVRQQELVAQDADLRLDLLHAEAVLQQEALKLVPHLAQLRRGDRDRIVLGIRCVHQGRGGRHVSTLGSARYETSCEGRIEALSSRAPDGRGPPPSRLCERGMPPPHAPARARRARRAAPRLGLEPLEVAAQVVDALGARGRRAPGPSARRASTVASSRSASFAARSASRAAFSAALRARRSARSSRGAGSADTGHRPAERVGEVVGLERAAPRAA